MAAEPNFERLGHQRQAGDHGCHWYAQGIHPNRYLYKYYWWVFWKGSPCDGWEFIADTYRLSTAAAMRLMAELRERQEPHWVYSKKVPRWDPPHTPWDPASSRWQGTEWAPALTDDFDPEWQGFK